MTTGLVITIADVQRAGYCPSGARSWAEGQGIDFKRMTRGGGIPASELIATGDANALRVVELARKARPNG